MRKINTVLVDDHHMVISGILKSLENEQDIKVMDAVDNPEKLYDILLRKEVDVLVMDIRMNDYNGIELTKQITHEFPNTKVIILSGYNFEEYVRSAFKAGAKGFIAKENSINKLADAIRKVNDGKTAISISLTDPTYSENRLTETETKVLHNIAKDMTNLDISLSLGMSKRTVEHHVSTIIQKLNCFSRVGAVVEGIKRGIIDPFYSKS
ncbi:response regulator transcription factor [Guptibacillus hwajinpoensis]|uniref:response regulator transcription factor n=1 Tax=Guptibacillus hwajinpoensis TaxID=208199 RepID=UPI00069DC7FF|nr:response regulator transcription factor [Alkalihalobacillus macyae]